ncbi:MAG: response regulator [Rhodospirillales bacterium]|nr:response regulator [Alphaproteobacteria bacterium]USO06659.1 MAG: response regulator [Rhodospirillales bacterium]
MMSKSSQENYPKDGGSYEAWPHVLVVDDDRRIRDLLCRYLSEQGFVVIAAADAFEATALLESFEVDVLVVDVMMPGKTGLEFTAGYRESGSVVPILLLTALGETEDRITGLEAGADDYLSKPFEPRELVLRLNAILKRTAKPVHVERSLKIGPWVFDPVHEELSAGGDVVRLTSAEAQLLKALGARGGEVLSREELARACGVDAGERTIDVQVTRLRRKIENDTKKPRYLQTVRGKGYVLRSEEL